MARLSLRSPEPAAGGVAAPKPPRLQEYLKAEVGYSSVEEMLRVLDVASNPFSTYRRREARKGRTLPEVPAPCRQQAAAGLHAACTAHGLACCSRH